MGYLAEQVKVDPRLFADYRRSGRTIESHRAQIRAALGFRECSEADQQKLTEWLAREMCASEQGREQLRDAVLAQCRVLHLEPPSFGQIARLVGSALMLFKRFCTTIEQRLDTVEVGQFYPIQRSRSTILRLAVASGVPGPRAAGRNRVGARSPPAADPRRGERLRPKSGALVLLVGAV